MPFFWHVKTGTFAKSACFQVPKNDTSGAETKKREHLCVSLGDVCVCVCVCARLSCVRILQVMPTTKILRKTVDYERFGHSWGARER